MRFRPEELREFEEHLVDCQECADRLLLAEMFHARNGHKPKPDPEMVARVVLYKPKQRDPDADRRRTGDSDRVPALDAYRAALTASRGEDFSPCSSS